MTAHRYTVLLECDHSITFTNPTPVLGETIYCIRCQDFRAVTSCAPDYSVRCLDCRYNRHTGPARITADTAADRHSRKYRTHTVIIYDGMVTIDRRAPRNSVESSLGDAPPF